jgi:hypothetical protein
LTRRISGRIVTAALEVEAFCRERGWRFCIIGGLAVLRWGEPRLTRDVDLTILTGFGAEETYLDALLGHFRGRRPDARAFALRSRVVLLTSSRGVPIDAALGGLPFEERAVARASQFDLGAGRTVTTCSAEDLIVLKAFAGRAHDWTDIEGIAVRQGDRLDEALIWEELVPLLELKEGPEAAERLAAALRTARD